MLCLKLSVLLQVLEIMASFSSRHMFLIIVSQALLLVIVTNKAYALNNGVHQRSVMSDELFIQKREFDTKRVQRIVNGWRKLSDEDRINFKSQIEEINDPSYNEQVSTINNSVHAQNETIYEDIDVYSYLSYLYYYITIEWDLDRVPDNDKYWIGVFKFGASDKEYLGRKWIRKLAKGKHSLGKLQTKADLESVERQDQFELRIFREDKRLPAVSDRLHGVVYSPPINLNIWKKKSQTANRVLEPELESFILAIKTIANTKHMTQGDIVSTSASVDDLINLWREFDKDEQQLLFPILEHDCVSSEIRNPTTEEDDLLEPSELYPNLGDTTTEASHQDDTVIPHYIYLKISLDHSYTYVYPVVNTRKNLKGSYSWIGIYRSKNTTSYPASGYLTWQWVGPGYQKSSKLSYIGESKKGPIYQKYVGPIFDSINGAYKHIGFASDIIQAAISVTPPPYIGRSSIDFDVNEALLCAYLSDIAYKDYSTVINKVRQYSLHNTHRIHNSKTGVNGYIASNSNTIVIAFSTKNSIGNSLMDASFWPVKVTRNKREYAHTGFVRALNSVYDSIKNKIKNDLGKKKLYITGHGLGGALASLLTFRLSVDNRQSEPTLYAFGCPPVGDKAFSDFFEGLPSYIITIKNDPLASGSLINIGPWNGFFKPMEEYYLNESKFHYITDYINQLEELQK